MADWSDSDASALGGRFQMVITKMTKGGQMVDVSNFRGAPVQINSYEDADPFGDATMEFVLPAITPWDDFDAYDLFPWLGYYSNVDLWWVPGIPDAAQYDAIEVPIWNPLSRLRDIIAPTNLRNSSGAITGDNRIKLFEGYIADFGQSSQGQKSDGLTVQCQGALFQHDRYYAKPFFPARPWTLEALIADIFNPVRKPNLRTYPLYIDWPEGWELKTPAYSGATANSYQPVGVPGGLWSGYTSRQTGAWDRALTGFVQDQLSSMITDARSGVTERNQWTIRHAHTKDIVGTLGPSTGRHPILCVRDRFRAPDFSVWVGQVGVDLQLNGDSTQSENVIYGSGTNVDGTGWNNAIISIDGSRTDYQPLAFDAQVYPVTPDNKSFDPHAFTSEAYTNYSGGFDLSGAQTVAAQQLARDSNPGWTGTITLSTDPSLEMPRWLIRAGMTVLLKGFAGSGDRGVPFHIASRSAAPMDGTVTLTVDTRYRDLLSIAEAQERTRDPLDPVKMLQVGKESSIIGDLRAPWNYNAGSGFLPKTSIAFHKTDATTDQFPYESWAKKHPPLHYGSYYIKCQAGAPTRNARWAAGSFVASEKDSIARTEMAVYDVNGNLLKIPFHLSFYYINVGATDMPFSGPGGSSPYLNNAFEKVDPTTGFATDNTLWAANGFIIGWGNQAGGQFNRAGFWPGRETIIGAQPTGLFVDEAPWSFDRDTFGSYFAGAQDAGFKLQSSDVLLYYMLYAEYTEPVYFMGRLYRQNPTSPT